MYKSFVCGNCKRNVFLKAPGTRNRNHCPFCLYSLHIDMKIGDRRSSCGGLMQPIGKIFKLDGEEVLIHKCLKCEVERKNRVAGDDSEELVKNLPVLDHRKYL